MDYLKTLKKEELVQISNDFDYLSVTNDFVGLKLMPMARTENMKVAIYELLEGHDIPVSALVHALDSEARIGDRPEYEEIKYELVLIKEKINQGEELKKKVRDLGMSVEGNGAITAIYNDISNQIAKVLVGFERRACELLSTGKNVIKENGADVTIDHKLSSNNKIDFSGWATPTHDILADLVALKNASNDKIVRLIVSSKVMGYIVANEAMSNIASKAGAYATRKFAQEYILANFDIDFIVDDRTFKFKHSDTKQYRFFDEMTVIALTTRGEVGTTFMTSTPTEDFAETDAKYGFVAVDQYIDNDPKAMWTLAEGLGLSVIPNINQTLYISKITA